MRSLLKQTESKVKDKDLTPIFSSPLSGFHVHYDDFQTIKVQLRALGLIAKSDKPRSVKDVATYWTLTPYGDDVMTRLRAIKRVAVQEEEPQVENTKTKIKKSG